MTMPSRWLIAKYWLRKGGFDLCEDTPMCFACRWFGRANDRRMHSLQASWEQSRLERCHLIPRSQGGTTFPSNLVLLCKRCHNSAPAVGSSAEPMIRWIQRRENHYVWILRRMIEECRAIDPQLPERFIALGWTAQEQQAALNAALRFLKVAHHVGGDPTATIAQSFDVVVRFQDQIERAMREAHAGGNLRKGIDEG